MKMLKIIVSIAAMIFMLTGMIIPAYADCRWADDNQAIRAEWDDAAGKVTIQLFKGSSYKVGNKVRLSSDRTSYDFTGLIKNTGPGSYKFQLTDQAGRIYESELYQADESIIETLFTSSWSFENNVWLLKNNKGDTLKGWQFVEDKWYYLDAQTGVCLMNTVTPDGYYVDSDGAWDGLPSK